MWWSVKDVKNKNGVLSAAAWAEAGGGPSKRTGERKDSPGARFQWLPTLAALLAGGMLQLVRYLYLNRTPFLRGADAYYYALQSRALRELGKLLIPDASPLLRLMALTSRTGLGDEQTVNLWVVLIQLLGALNLFLAGRWLAGPHKERKRTGLSLYLYLWALLSPTFLFTCLEFPKYALGLACLPLWPVALVNVRLWPVSAGAVILACLCHRAFFGFAGLGVAGLMFALWRRKGRKRLTVLLVALGRKRLLSAAGGLLLLAIAFGVILGRGTYFSLADLARFNWEEVRPSFLTFLCREGLPMVLKAEGILGVLVAGLLLLQHWRRKGKAARKSLPLATWLWWPFFLFLLVFPLGSAEIMGIPERLSLALPLVIMLLLAGGFWLPEDAPEHASFLGCRAVPGWVLFWMIVIISIVFPGGGIDLVHPARLDPDYALYEEVTTVLAGMELPMVIVHQGLHFYYKYRTLREAFAYEPEDHWPKELIWRVAYGISPAEWAAYLPPDALWESGKLLTLPGPYSLIREDLWQQFREAVRESGDQYLQERVFSLWLNPSQKRPAFLYEKHRPGEDEGVFSALPKP